MPDETTEEQPEQELSATEDVPQDLGEAGKKALKTEREARKALEARIKELEPLAARAQELEDAQKSDHQKLQEQLDQERQQRLEAAVDAARYRAAVKFGLAEEDLDLLGDDPEQIEARAERFAARLAAAAPEPAAAPSRRPQERLKPGASPDAPPEASPKEIAAALFKGR